MKYFLLQYRLIFYVLLMVDSVKGVPDTLHLRWQWDVVDCGEQKEQLISLFSSKKFILGTATAEYQICGAARCPDSNWASWEQRVPIEPAGDACRGDIFRLNDIALLKELGVTAYRFSVDWSWIEPTQGEYNYAALEHYRSFCRELHAAGIKVMVTLHHFVHPQWFEDMGAFENEENIMYFVEFCARVYRYLADDVDWWCTINEPGIYVSGGYIRGVFPPGKSVGLRGKFKPEWFLRDGETTWRNIPLAARVSVNLVRAHIAVYELLKSLQREGGIGLHEPSIGLAHQYLIFEAFHHLWNPKGMIEAAVAHTFTSWSGGSIFELLRTGKFSFSGAVLESVELPKAPHSYDWIGLNYYSHVFVDLDHQEGPGYYDEDIPTDMPYGLYAEGLYRALKDMARLGKPIYVTENGIADAKDDRRDIWCKRYLHAVGVALKEGVDVRGYFYWSFMDNFEWDMGYTQKFGLYQVDMSSPEKTRTLRPGARYFRDVAHSVKS